MTFAGQTICGAVVVGPVGVDPHAAAKATAVAVTHRFVCLSSILTVYLIDGRGVWGTVALMAAKNASAIAW